MKKTLWSNLCVAHISCKTLANYIAETLGFGSDLFNCEIQAYNSFRNKIQVEALEKIVLYSGIVFKFAKIS